MKYFNLDNRSEKQFAQGNHFPVSANHLSIWYQSLVRSELSAFYRHLWFIGVLIEKKAGGLSVPTFSSSRAISSFRWATFIFSCPPPIQFHRIIWFQQLA
jgi:hypothetical protein